MGSQDSSKSWFLLEHFLSWGRWEALSRAFLLTLPLCGKKQKDRWQTQENNPFFLSCLWPRGFPCDCARNQSGFGWIPIWCIIYLSSTASQWCRTGGPPGIRGPDIVAPSGSSISAWGLNAERQVVVRCRAYLAERIITRASSSLASSSSEVTFFVPGSNWSTFSACNGCEREGLVQRPPSGVRTMLSRKENSIPLSKHC